MQESDKNFSMRGNSTAVDFIVAQISGVMLAGFVYQMIFPGKE